MKLLTLARDLRRRKARERNQQFVVEGVRSVEMLLASAIDVAGILCGPALRDDNRGLAILARANRSKVEILEVSDAEFASAAHTDTPQGVLAIAGIPKWELVPPPPKALYVILDAIQDPGNVGTIVRTAAAFGVTATIALPGTVDFWNAKVVRSTMGAIFSQVVVEATREALNPFLAQHQISCWAADTQGTPLSEMTHSFPDRFALVVSNEGAGLSADAALLATARVAIPMAAPVESLNVAVATGILLHAFRNIAR